MSLKNGRISVSDAARRYLDRGWYCVPIPPRKKQVILKNWPELRLSQQDVGDYFSSGINIGVILGEPSNWLVDVDLDCAEARELADQYLPPTPAVTGRPSAPNSHRWYYAEGAKTEKYSDPKTREMIVELRSTGVQTVVGPSIHPDDEPYDVLEGEPAKVAAPMLSACVLALADAVIKARYGNIQPAVKSAIPIVRSNDVDDLDIERRAIAYLDAMPPAISGQSGHNATYAAATAIVHGFGIATARALDLLLMHFNPRCVPEWTEKELRHKVDQAATKPHDRPFGWLRDSPSPLEINCRDTDVDISGLIGGQRAPVMQVIEDPGVVPQELLRVPGFVSEVMDHCLATAPYPNLALAFCGALSLQALLAGRKVRDCADNRTNLYLLALAYSSVGKDWPRKVNTHIMHRVGMVRSLGEKFASGEGIQDSLFQTPAMLFQTDEIDGMLQSINKSRDARHENIMGTLLTMYSTANSIYPMRRKAGKESPGVIDQPCLVVYGTAIPTHYYDALSERMLTNGFFGRMLIVESGPRGAGQEPGIINPPASVMDAAQWWANFSPGEGNLENWHPQPKIVEADDDARDLIAEARVTAETEYANAESRGDPVGTTVWGRVPEQIRKLALLYAVSVSYKSPRIAANAVRWATEFMLHQTRRMLFMAGNHVAENPFHAECLKLLRKLREAPGRELAHSVLLKRMKTDAKTFQELVTTLEQQGDVVTLLQATAGRPQRNYRLVSETNGDV